MRNPIAHADLSNPGAGSSRTIYDSDPTGDHSNRPQHATKNHRCTVSFYTNVADATFIVEWYPRGGATPRPVSSAVVPVNTYFQRDVRILPGRTVVRIATVTNPGTWELAAELSDDQALAQ
jgi:hypothetical protein